MAEEAWTGWEQAAAQQAEEVAIGVGKMEAAGVAGDVVQAGRRVGGRAAESAVEAAVAGAAAAVAGQGGVVATCGSRRSGRCC